MTTIGLDIGGSCVKAARLERDQWDLRRSPHYAAAERDVKAAVATVMDNWGTVTSLGIAVPGVLADDRSHVVAAANLPGLIGLSLRDLCSSHRLQPVVATDQVAAATDLAAAHDLRGRLLSISIGTGVGGAVLDLDDRHPLGRPLRVDGDSSGHLGQLDVAMGEDPPIGPDGGAGGVEAYLGADARRGREAASFEMDDPAMHALVRLLRISHAMYRPHHIALLGGFGRRLWHLNNELMHATNQRLTNLARPGWRLHFGDDDFHAARGAARLAAIDV